MAIFGYAGHCACVGSTCWALLCKCTRLCWATHGWPRNKGNVEQCWAKSLTSFKFDSTRLNTSQQGVQMRSTCWELVQWTNPVHLHVALWYQVKYLSAPQVRISRVIKKEVLLSFRDRMSQNFLQLRPTFVVWLSFLSFSHVQNIDIAHDFRKFHQRWKYTEIAEPSEQDNVLYI